MCPICWATLLATFSLTVAGSATLIAGRDRIVLTLALPLIALGLVHRVGITMIPSWVFVVLLTAVAVRMVWVLTRHKGHTLIGSAWRRATKIASGSCPKRRAESQTSNPERLSFRGNVNTMLIRISKRSFSKTKFSFIIV